MTKVTEVTEVTEVGEWLEAMQSLYPCKITYNFMGYIWLSGWWFGTWMLWLSIQLGMSSSQLTFTPSFFRGVGQPLTRFKCLTTRNRETNPSTISTICRNLWLMAICFFNHLLCSSKFRQDEYQSDPSCQALVRELLEGQVDLSLRDLDGNRRGNSQNWG